MNGPLHGVRVIDFCWVGAGSFTTKILADHGADVIKVESAAKVDGIRLSPPFAGGQAGLNRSGYFADRNTSKRSISLDMKTEGGRELARRLVTDCDVVANNFTPGTMDRFGLGWESVHRLNPRAVYLAMSMQGDSGPERDYLGYGSTISALVGLHHFTAVPGRPPLGTGTNYPDHVPNPCHAAFALLAALRHRRRTGEGQYIDVAQTEPTIALLGPLIMDWTVNGRDAGPQGNGHARRAPHGVYRCAGEDRWIAISVLHDEQWPALVRVLGLSGPHEEWRDMDGRHRDRERLDAALAAAVAERTAPELAARLRAAGVPAALVQNAADLVDDDPQLAEREHWLRMDHPEMGDSLYNAPPFRLTGTPVRPQRPAPLLGQHTGEVLRDVLGLTDAEIEEYRGAGVLR
ncbi:CaiB/BaiF CoA-transferase family protein [Pseudonocardia sp. MH-G8]|uniref:CaiB/BaiF CoA transferase family protein n=1 Tax=Pseudonocardia sp. MH-G8 TaxID=1854588 RepID=UPI000BA00CB6|nr:CoA transferase [Pseudonocardia sp. MH-G8]OZM76871.1 CoA-transferase [Pseudonocardia sp. MH-G8]